MFTLPKSHTAQNMLFFTVKHVAKAKLAFRKPLPALANPGTTSILEACGPPSFPSSPGATMGPEISQKGYELHKSFKPRDESDVMVATMGKTGTTLVSQMVHQIRTAHHGGDETFEDINDVMPWPEIASACGYDLEADHPDPPRMFKRHERLSHMHGDDCRYVVTLRHPIKQLISAADFLTAKNFFHGNPSVTPDKLAFLFMPEQMEYHVEYWRARHCTDKLLILHYEALVKDMEGTAQMVANWLGIALTDEQRKMVAERCSKGYMGAPEHVGKFDDSKAYKLAMANGRTDLEGLQPSPKIRADDAPRSEVGPEGWEFYHHLWEKVMKPETGCESYEEYAKALSEGNNARWK